jgi:hypothetical protein
MFWPNVIRPKHGAVSRTRSYRLLYVVIAPFLPMLQWALPSSILTTEIVGRAMIRVAKGGYSRQILEPADIYAAGREHGGSQVTL